MNTHLDVVTFGEPMAMFYANEPGPLHESNSFSKALAGAETNVATGLSRLGLNVGLVTKLGDDNFGRFIIDALNQEKIDTQSVAFTEDYSTGMLVKSKVLTGDPVVEYFRKNSAASKLDVSDFNEDYFSSARHMHMTSIPAALSKECHEFSIHAMKFMKKLGKKISFDPNLRPKLWADTASMVNTINDLATKCDWFLPGISEGKTLTGFEKPEDIASYYLERGISLVVVKLGAEGAYYKTADQEGYVHGFHVANVVDTVGAGDGFAVGVVSALLDGLSVEEATRRGNAIGALAVMSPGDSDGLPTREELDAFMKL
ncbi:sugar kinase [Paenibacillus macquariensis]|uniref:2-keto-3-deoxygluconate kinase n=1 Tax=Paenibacillus macquariensis TaxID=948756 RepID=A0ABY1JKS8_9BACL|nr:sugar kinase [Paenibacillus macquariensis]MEC0090005.1 sugar kinase [Paenibacillus macquariensis]OAB31110.1 2-dehydro-3-deoxygluconokinase [Paenibacillus macquariensis subsp. macquariensis]SIQ35962.1 2-keto-3-deoxygluconate kinase [Paenibacillus macquariensis]